MSNPLNITVTPEAQTRLNEIAQGGVIRLDIKSTGCSGHSYEMNRAEAAEASDDVMEFDGVKLAIPKTKSWMLIGTVIGFEETDFASEFTFTNPNEKGRCGCGESFTL